ncbi:MAG TPA: TonB-dependent receptor [Steroidobacteraceae bacterium]|nr:TonB-dependent receptor [Steroidobacteraceae bacterium]
MANRSNHCSQRSSASAASGLPLRVPAAASALALVLALSGTAAHAQSQPSRQAKANVKQQTADAPALLASNEPNAVLQEVVVTGQRAAIQSAQRIKQLSDQIVDSVVAADIGKLPDRSVTEVLQRIPGIDIDHTFRNIAGGLDPEHFVVEGSGVTIRGLTYVLSEVNGRNVFSANGGRALSFDDVPPELMAGVDVYKNPDAEQIEGGIGGIVNLRTAKPFDFSGARISGSAGGTWGDLSRGNVKPSTSLLLSDRWHTGIGDIGFLADIAYSESLERTDAMEANPYFPRVASVEGSKSPWIPAGQTLWVPGGVASWRYLQFKRTREGAYTALQWQPTDNIRTSLTYFRSDYRFHWNEFATFPQGNPYDVAPAAGTSFTFAPNGLFQSGTLSDPAEGGLPFGDDARVADQRSITNDLSWNLIWDVTDKLKLTSDLQLVRGNTHGDDFTVATGVNAPSETINLTGAFPDASIDQSFMGNPANYYWSFTQDGLSQAYGKEWAWREDADYALGDGFFKSIRAGLRADERTAQTDVSEPGNAYQWAAVSQTWMVPWNLWELAYLNQFPAPTTSFSFPNFFNGRVKLPSAAIFPAMSLANGWPNSFALLQSFRNAVCNEKPNSNCAGYTWTPASLVQAPGSAPAGGLNTQNEHTYAAYLELPFGAHVGALPFEGNVGVRVVRTVDAANGYLVVSQFLPNPPKGFSAAGYSAFNASAQALTANDSYTDVLPSLNLVFHLRRDLQSRLAISEGMSRPDFSQLQAFTTLGSSIDSGSGIQSFTGAGNGNPHLKPTRAFQLDGTLEWYFASTGSLTADVFYKHLTDVIINNVFEVQATDTAGAAHEFTTTGPINGASGEVKGFELDYQQYYDFLPGILRGFGTQANFTYVDSHQTLNNPITSAYCTSSSGNPDNLNLNLNGCDTDGRTFGDLPLMNLSKYTYNLALLYDRGPLSARLAYSWRSKYLMGVNVHPVNGTNALNTDASSAGFGSQNVAYGLPFYADDYGQLDASVFYKITSNVTLGFEALNLTDSIYKELQQQHVATTTFAWYDSGRTYSAQVRVTF